jgi:hypothetical protein
MKVRNDKDTTGTNPFTKISLIDNFSISGGYNMAVDSMQWSTFSTNLRLKIGKSYSLNLSGAFDPYMYGLNSSGNPVRINKLRWANGGFPRFLGTGTSASYTLNNETFKKLFSKKKSEQKAKKTEGTNSEDELNPTDTESNNNLENSSNDQSKKEVSADGYQKFSIPWNISASYSVRYGNTNVFNKDKMEYEMDFTHNLSFSGGIDLTANWKISSSTSYDFTFKQLTSANISVTRLLHCWTMTANINPFGPFKTYSFHIGVNASMLSDLKYDKQSEGANNITWY